ncbi:MAG: divergent polysaccharide deacetylase family protein [Vulcanimicrobiaceae bacterium]
MLLLLATAIAVVLFYAIRPVVRHTAIQRGAPAKTPEKIPEPRRPFLTPWASAIPTGATPAQSKPAISASPLVRAGGHRLAIIIDDCGQWPQTERALIALPIALTLSVMPKERYTQTIAQEAAAAGQGVMLHLPMEPLAPIDPGPGKVTTAMSDAAIAAQVKEDLGLVPLAKGVNNHEGSKASADARVMQDIVSVLAPEGLYFIDSRTSAQSVAAQVAASAGMRTASRDVFLDNNDDRDAVETMLRTAASVALENGSAIAIGHPRAATLQAIRALIPELQGEGITFVQAAELVH